VTIVGSEPPNGGTYRLGKKHQNKYVRFRLAEGLAPRLLLDKGIPPLGGLAPPPFLPGRLFFGLFRFAPILETEAMRLRSNRMFRFALTTLLASPAALALPSPKGLEDDPATNASSNIAENTGKNALHVVIDPGHGGRDTGAARGRLKEAEIALKVSLKLAELLKKDPRFRVSLTRTQDETLTLPRRAKIANEAHADLFVSIHLNSSADPRARGKEFYFQNQLPADEEAMFLASRENAEQEVADSASQAQKPPERLSAQADLRRILDDLRRNERIISSSELTRTLHETWLEGGKSRKSGSRAIRQAPFYVVSNVNAPSVLVELGFLTHAQEGPRLGTAEYQEELATSLYNGLAKYKEIVDKDR
jgi:N-acetylmuramoyl-L-alanine amidase